MAYISIDSTVNSYSAEDYIQQEPENLEDISEQIIIGESMANIGAYIPFIIMLGASIFVFTLCVKEISNIKNAPPRPPKDPSYNDNINW